MLHLQIGQRYGVENETETEFRGIKMWYGWSCAGSALVIVGSSTAEVVHQPRSHLGLMVNESQINSIPTHQHPHRIKRQLPQRRERIRLDGLARSYKCEAVATNGERK